MSTWVAPAEGTAKINTGQSSTGAVARAHKGLVFISFCRRMGTCNSIEEAEASAALIGLSALLKVYKGDVILEVDNTFIARQLNEPATSR